ncbi:MAG TPA: YceI family protein [Candidatus Dormibacteraeota bacterium]|nr:YceI family protein [Candidatus Dormibacteraeota bacterium]
MRAKDWKSLGIGAAAIAGLAVLLSASAAPPRMPIQHPAAATPFELSFIVDPGQSKVHWTVDSTLHTVHGTFALKSGALHFDPETGKASGEIVVLATSGDSNNSSRDEKMHKLVLESAKYPDAAFRPTQVEGKVAASGNSDVQLHGIFLLHGSEHELSVPVHAELGSGKWRGTAKFEVPYILWGLKDPSNWLLKVRPAVQVDLELAGTWKQGE